MVILLLTNKLYLNFTFTFSHPRLEGVTALYSGLAPGLQRQAVFSSLRIGLYERLRNIMFSRAELSQTSTGGQALVLRVAAGLTSGSVGISVAQPMDVVKIR